MNKQHPPQSPARQPISNTKISERIDLIVALRTHCPTAVRDNFEKRLVGAEQALQWVLGRTSALPRWVAKRADAIRAAHPASCVCPICRKAYDE